MSVDASLGTKLAPGEGRGEVLKCTQIVKTKLGTQDVSQFTVDNIIQCLKDNGYGELPEELGQEALDNYFDMRQGKAESIFDYFP